MSTQKQLDSATDDLADMARKLDKLEAAARRGAVDFCERGDNDTSAALWSILADLKAAGGSIAAALSKGRALAVPDDGGVITPKSGGK